MRRCVCFVSLSGLCTMRVGDMAIGHDVSGDACGGVCQSARGQLPPRSTGLQQVPSYARSAVCGGGGTRWRHYG